MRHTADDRHGWRVRAVIVVLWRAGLRICEALALAEADLDPRRGSLLVRRGKGGRRREVGMDDWAWEQLEPWLTARVELPIGPLFCVVNGPTRGRPWSASAARSDLRHVARQAGVRRRFAPHQLRHAHAVEMAREGVPLIVIQRRSRPTQQRAGGATRCARTAPLPKSRSLPLRSWSSSGAGAWRAFVRRSQPRGRNTLEASVVSCARVREAPCSICAPWARSWVRRQQVPLRSQVSSVPAVARGHDQEEAAWQSRYSANRVRAGRATTRW